VNLLPSLRIAFFPVHNRPLEHVGQVEVPKNIKALTWEEIRQHNSDSTGCWLVIDGFVRDVTLLMHDNVHPGGAEVFKRLIGKDATTAFNNIGHSNEAKLIATNFIVGRLKQDDVIVDMIT